jgi:hypothetical protein
VAKSRQLHEAAKLHDARHLAAVHCTKLRIATLLLLLLLRPLLLLRGRGQACTSSKHTHKAVHHGVKTSRSKKPS